jgi:hypothetical protein
MTTEKDITDKRDEDVALLNNKIREAITIQNGLAINDPQQHGLDNTITELMRSRTDLRIQQLMAGLHSAQLAAALAKITKASDDLKKEADKMKTATTFINNTNAVVGAATKVTNIVKNGG